VLEEGTVAAGDRIEVVERPAASVTVAESVRAYHGDAELMRRILALPGVTAKWRRIAERVLSDGAG
jgi:MOSC domain-containing protein YiiM